MARMEAKTLGRIRRHRRIRKRVIGLAARPRLCVHRSHKHLYAQLVDDFQGKVLLGVSTLDEALKKATPAGGNITAATQLGKRVAELAKQKGITAVVFDRGGYIYHGRIKALADAAREGGLQF